MRIDKNAARQAAVLAVDVAGSSSVITPAGRIFVFTGGSLVVSGTPGAAASEIECLLRNDLAGSQTLWIAVTWVSFVAGILTSPQTAVATIPRFIAPAGSTTTLTVNVTGAPTTVRGRAFFAGYSLDSANQFDLDA